MEATKILILIGDVGGGHMAPAKALKHVFENKYPGQYQIRILDLFTVADVAPYNTSEASYTLFTHNHTLQRINDMIFRMFNTNGIYSLFKRYTMRRLLTPTKAIINTEDPDIVITNNPIVTSVVSEIKQRGGKFFSVAQITDLDQFFRPAADRNSELVISPSEMATARLAKWGVPKERIFGNYFSIRPQIQKLRPKQEIYQELNLRPDLKTVLIMGGGLGTSKYLLDAVHDLIVNTEFQVIIMTGKLERLNEELSKKYADNPRVRIQGWVANVQDFYVVADVVVAKPGMSVILECELFEKLTIMIRKVALQELGNVKYALKNPRFRYLGDDWNKLTEYALGLLREDLPEKTSRRSFSETEIIVDKIIAEYQKSRSKLETAA